MKDIEPLQCNNRLTVKHGMMQLLGELSNNISLNNSSQVTSIKPKLKKILL